MLVIKVEMWPMGSEADARQIGELRIWNDGSGNFAYGNYKAEAKHAGIYYGKDGNYKTGIVKRFKRTLSPYHLIARALKNMGIE